MEVLRHMATKNISHNATDEILLHDPSVLTRDTGSPSKAWVAENDRHVVVAFNYEPRKMIEFQVRPYLSLAALTLTAIHIQEQRS